jgi:signal transduction histidine kinase/CheY-like chemotaxis protein
MSPARRRNPWLQLLHDWQDRSLGNAFALRASLIAIGSSLFVALIFLGILSWTDRATFQQHLHDKAGHAAERIEGTIGVLEDASARFAKNPLLMTALLDSEGRAAYVVPFLSNFGFPIPAQSGMALCDVNGEKLASMLTPLSACHAESPLFKRVVAGERLLREIVKLDNGHLVWVVYSGVIFSYTDTVEGVLVTQLDLHDVMNALPKDLDVQAVVLVRKADGVELSRVDANTPTGEQAGPVSHNDMLKAKAFMFAAAPGASPYPLEIEVQANPASMAHFIGPLVAGLTLGTLVLTAFVVVWARLLARSTFGPLLALTKTARAIADSGDLNTPIAQAAFGEVGALAYAFEKMVSTLREAQANLEHKVEQRTAELYKSQIAAQAASHSKSQFLANMSHEIRTPMNAILGMLTLLRKTDLTTRQADYAAKSDGAARALLGLLNEILDFSKIEAGKMTLDPHPFAVEQLLADLSVILSSSAGTKPVEVLFDIDPQLPSHLLGDAMRLQQVLINLGGNAIKFTAQGEVVLSIAIVQRSADAVTLKVAMRDTGIGIAPENQARIFSGFTQAEASTTRQFGGTGLGVAISQRFVQMMGGDLALHSTLGEGSLFYFTITLPIVQAPIEENALPSNGPLNVPLRVLVIDDNPTARELLARTCLSLGWQVDTADGGDQALKLLQNQSANDLPSQAAMRPVYQAIFVDWHMPGMDGWQTSQHIRALGLSSNASLVVMVTAQSREALSQRSQTDQLLLDGFLVKPITASMLLQAVQDARSNPVTTPQAPVQSGGQRLKGMHLLVVEDNLNNQQVARELLEDEGATVQIANHGQEGLEAIAAADPPFDVVLMDLQMPVMDGYAATLIVRRDLGMLSLPIVAMTANAMASDREACLSAGMNDHIGKPFDLNDLVRVLRKQACWKDSISVASLDAPILAEAVELAANDAGVDIQAALQRLGGKHDVYRRILRTFCTDLRAMPTELQGHATQGESQNSQRVLHTLKGLAATLGATALAAQASAGEKAMAQNPDAAAVQSITHAACAAIAQALPGLDGLVQAFDNAAPGSPVDAQANDAPWDAPALQLALQALVQLLQANDMQSMESMAQLQSRFGQALGERLAPLEAAMADLDFERALELCKSLG